MKNLEEVKTSMINSLVGRIELKNMGFTEEKVTINYLSDAIEDFFGQEALHEARALYESRNPGK